MYFRLLNVDNSCRNILALNGLLIFHLCSQCQLLSNTWHQSLWLAFSLHYAAVRSLWPAGASFWCVMQDSQDFISPNTFILSSLEKRLPVICIHISNTTATAAATDTSAISMALPLHGGLGLINVIACRCSHARYCTPCGYPLTTAHCRDSRACRDWTGCLVYESALIWYSGSELVLSWDEL